MLSKNPSGSFIKMRSTFFFSLIIILGIAILYLFRPFFYPIFWAAVIAVMFRPAYCFFYKLLKHQNISSLITLILVIIIIFLPLTLLSTLIINESYNLYQKVSNSELIGKVGEVSNWLGQNKFLAPHIQTIQNNWTQYAENTAKTVSLFLFENLKNITQNSLWLLFEFFIMLYSLFFFLKDGDKILKRLMHLSPLGDEYETMLYQRFTSTARATLKGTLVVGSIQGILGGLLFWATGIQGALVWGVIMILLAIVPAVGCSIVWFPAGIIMLATGNTWQGLTILLFGFFVISLIDNLLRPIIVGRDIEMHPVVTLLSTLGGLFIFGISGFVIGPVLAALFLAVVSIYDHHYKNELGKN